MLILPRVLAELLELLFDSVIIETRINRCIILPPVGWNSVTLEADKNEIRFGKFVFSYKFTFEKCRYVRSCIVFINQIGPVFNRPAPNQRPWLGKSNFQLFSSLKKKKLNFFFLFLLILIWKNLHLCWGVSGPSYEQLIVKLGVLNSHLIIESSIVLINWMNCFFSINLHYLIALL